jgi:hypothetical protein
MFVRRMRAVALLELPTEGAIEDVERRWRAFLQTCGATVVDWHFDSAEGQTQFDKTTPQRLSHPFVATPNKGKCSSCGKSRTHPIHRFT